MTASFYRGEARPLRQRLFGEIDLPGVAAIFERDFPVGCFLLAHEMGVMRFGEGLRAEGRIVMVGADERR